MSPTAPIRETLRPLADVFADLRKPIPDRLLETRKQGGATLTYIPWHHAQKLLDHYTGGAWEYQIVESSVVGKYVTTLVEVTVHGKDGSVSRQGRGVEEVEAKGYGDPLSNSESMAFRRACARLGLGLHLYEKD